MSNQNNLAKNIYRILSQGGLEYKENLEKDGLLKSIDKEDLEAIIDPEHEKCLSHMLSIHGLLPKINQKLLTKEVLTTKDRNGQTPLTYALRYQTLNGIPKRLLTKERLESKHKGTNLLQIATLSGQLDLIPLDCLDNKNLSRKDMDGESPLGSIMEIVDYITNKDGYHHYYSSPKIKENYKALLPKLLEKLDLENLKKYKSYAQKECLFESLDMLNVEIKKRLVQELKQSPIIDL
jgi:hypothetical protein